MDHAVIKVQKRNAVLDALSRNGVAPDDPMRAELEAGATIAASDNSRVIMKSGNSLDVEIQNRLSSRRMDKNQPTAPRTVSKSDTDAVRIYFTDIAEGKVGVTD